MAHLLDSLQRGSTLVAINLRGIITRTLVAGILVLNKQAGEPARPEARLVAPPDLPVVGFVLFSVSLLRVWPRLTMA